jgi:transposase
MYQNDWKDYMPIEFLRKLGDQLQDWCNKALDSGVESLKGFVRGIKQACGVPHFKAISQAFTSEWSNGQVEGKPGSRCGKPA